MPELSRRTLLGATGAAAATTLLPPSVHAAMAEPMRRGGLDAIEHVIVLMQENRSFDHYYGSLRGVRGFSDAHPLELPSGKSVFEQPNPAGGTVLPFSVRKAAELAGRKADDIQYLGDLDHSWNGSGKAWARGWNNGWIAAKTPATMTYYERRDIALQYELADTFTICDAYHCSIFGSTNPNRNFLWTGTTGFEPGSTTNRAVTNAAYSYDHKGYDWTTYPERIEAAGVPWQIYQEWDNFTDNAVEYFLPFKKVGTKILASVEGKFRTTEEFYDALPKKTPEERAKLLAQFDAGVAKLTPAERNLFKKAMYRSEPETLVTRLKADIQARRLPAVSWLVPSAKDSEHPGASTPVGSANLIYRVLDALASDRETWSKTVLLINFDENDGYFDHVPPPMPPGNAADDADHFNGQPLGFGPRVPMTVVSPWSIGGNVDSTVYDHTSVLRFLERWTGIGEPNISKWRRTVAGDLTGAFDFSHAGRQPRVNRPGPVPAPISRWRPSAPAEQSLPVAEPGNRPSRPLPYQVSVSGAVDKSGNLALSLANSGSSSAHFALYPYQGEFAEPAHRDVRGEAPELVRLAGDEYRVVVQGPNRSWWELRGNRRGAAAGVDVRTRFLTWRSGVEFKLSNSGTSALTLRLSSSRLTRVVRVGAGRSVTVDWPVSGGWYDVKVTADGDPSFLRTLTARVENGRTGVSC
ncbi:phospholipase C, phosphocholine-specific [Amycolatopsis sp. WAC 01376]|uniref:phosphocholine-specific phospholipase C n=1 Tax=Amycolatopsis sp. WAC 01376 TaxID=2203195 RepID=UPI000F77BBCD|nr:phospholipase C, phosphocholine-specific [Amycolatopsis sp. WAC 01376]RSM61249.1 phospholipase C, phosphocholine-specific [Amycolatopsis sp. WAC 01376]